MSRSALQRFRYVALAEGLSFLALLLVAMPLKYAFGMPMAVKLVGWVHGALFILYIAAAAHAALEQRWSPKTILGALIAAVLPFGTFVFDRRLEPAPEPDTAQ